MEKSIIISIILNQSSLLKAHKILNKNMNFTFKAKRHYSDQLEQQPYPPSLRKLKMSRRKQGAQKIFWILLGYLRMNCFRSFKNIQLRSSIEEYSKIDISQDKSQKEQDSKKRSNSTDPFTQYSRARLLKGITDNLKTRNQGKSILLQSEILGLEERIQQLQAMIKLSKETPGNASQEQTNMTLIFLMEEILKLKKQMIEQQDKSFQTGEVSHNILNYSTNQNRTQQKKPIIKQSCSESKFSKGPSFPKTPQGSTHFITPQSHEYQLKGPSLEYQIPQNNVIQQRPAIIPNHQVKNVFINIHHHHPTLSKSESQKEMPKHQHSNREHKPYHLSPNHVNAYQLSPKPVYSNPIKIEESDSQLNSQYMMGTIKTPETPRMDAKFIKNDSKITFQSNKTEDLSSVKTKKSKIKVVTPQTYKFGRRNSQLGFSSELDPQKYCQQEYGTKRRINK